MVEKGKLYYETPCPDCERFHKRPMLYPAGHPESSIAFCYVGGSRTEATDELMALIDKIIEWSQAYPLSVFPEPDHKATGHDPSLCSAAMGRHVINRLMELIPVALVEGVDA